jgi:hypothetical protein
VKNITGANKAFFFNLLLLLLVAGCGGSDSDYVFTQTADTPSAGKILSGRATYDRILPVSSVEPDQARSGLCRLDFANPQAMPCRFARIQLLDESDREVSSSHTDADGSYSLSVPDDLEKARVRLWAQSVPLTGLSAAIRIQDNTNGGAPYAAESELVELPVEALNLHLPSGYTLQGEPMGDRRGAGPFACLDGILSGYQYFLESGVVDDDGLPLCIVNWSERNEPTAPQDLATGAIETSFFSSEDNQLFILGAAESDTDEYDWHVLVHEFGHWVQFNRFRNDQIGGAHADGDIKDPRLAFGEGFGNALGAIVLGDPVYKDTSTPSGGASSLECNLSDNDPNPGWFSEATVGAVLVDLFDPVRQEGGDSQFDDRIQLSPAMFAGALEFQKFSPALTTIFSFFHGLEEQSLTSSEKTAFASLLQSVSPSEDFGLVSVDQFGGGETHDAGLEGAVSSLPVYLDVQGNFDGPRFPITVGGQLEEDTYNWLQGNRYLVFRGDGTDVTFTVHNSTSAVGGLAVTLYENGKELEDDDDDDDDDDDEPDPKEDMKETVSTVAGGVYVIVLTNFGTETSTVELELKHE